MDKLVFLFLAILIFSSCEEEKKEPLFYHSRLYPVLRGQYIWEKNEIFKDIPISIRLESRIDYDDPAYEGRFEPIDIEYAVMTLDKDIYINSDTIKRKSNLLKYKIAEIETYKVERSGGYIEDSYILWINKQNLPDFYVNKGYYTVYFSTKTKHDYFINDSTVIKIE